MEIHNLMEDLVVKMVEDIGNEEEKKSKAGYCTSEQCRLDVACFVLNRIPQHYVSSVRGIAHAEKALKENPQLLVDMVTLIHEGMKRVSHVQRPYYGHADAQGLPKGPVFVFPTIKGRFLSCTTFEPIKDVSVTLSAGGKPVGMIDERWQNPYTLDPKIEGTFLFLPRPVATDKAGKTEDFEFEIAVEDKKFEAFHHYFKIEVVSEIDPDLIARKTQDFKLADLYLAPL